MSSRKTQHQKREAARSRKAIDRAIMLCVRRMIWHSSSVDPLKIDNQCQLELVGLAIARRRL